MGSPTPSSRGNSRKDNHIKAEDVEDAKDVEITDASIAFNIFLNADLVVGFHPDGGTEPAIDFALARAIPFAVVPCCVFPSLFKERTNSQGVKVKTYEQFIEYLSEKHINMRQQEIHAMKPGSKRRILFMLKDDF
ncbi:hypothetical protein TrRE_jg8293 [Triparma retinervis]|uniref:Uncharacterized protein n=1 Tax=Triparma retinervis TaxID=2557542 RepID=A0A9W7EDZ5_9STRA|nr:hypothetical protein TrRE_jg8293 [Triparma retinervis]